MLPSETYYTQVPTTTLNARGTVDGHALDLLPEMVARYVEPFIGAAAASDGAVMTQGMTQGMKAEEPPLAQAR